MRSLLASYALGGAAVVLLVLGWITVQLAWRRAFPGGPDPDALAGRRGCSAGAGAAFPGEDCRRCEGRRRTGAGAPGSGCAEEERQ